ncbi:hypothetical protein C0992_011760 [Termitomyces sp. T32_za158]|nr:hypothetical protein C0992_011760 [Termitomyces sp. T32_za158]
MTASSHTAACKRVKTGSNVSTEMPMPKELKFKEIDTRAQKAGRRSMIYLMDFFDSCLPSMVAPRKHINSKGTREFGFYDRHLDEHLRLTRVICQPNLACDLAEVAEVALNSYLEAYEYLPPIIDDVSNSFPGPKKRDEALLKSEFERCVNESCVQRTYAATTAKHCTVVAATLEFQLSRWTEGMLLWDLNPEKGHTQAVADGFLKLRDLSEEPTDVNLSPRSDLYLCTQKNFAKGLGIWEFKSLKAGDKDVLNAILAHSKLPNFPWESCNHRKICKLMCGDKSNSKACSEGSDGSQSIWERTGPDADPPVVACSSNSSHTNDTEVTIPRLIMEKARRMLQQVSHEYHDIHQTEA